MVGKTFKQKFADIEDVFSIDDYIVLYNEAFGQKLKPGDLTGTDPIVARIERHTGAEYDHGKPADVLLRKRDEFLPKIEAETLNRFEKLFQAINATLGTSKNSILENLCLIKSISYRFQVSQIGNF